MKCSIVKAGWVPCLLMMLGCAETDCGEGPGYINITGIQGKNVQFQGEGYTLMEPLSENSQILYSQYGLSVQPEATYYNVTVQVRPSFSFFSAAYACDPPTPQPSEEIADIAIVSSADYVQASSSKVLAAGDTLNSIFIIYDYHSGRIVGLPDFLIDVKLKASDAGFILRPSVAPASPQLHQFTVHYHLTNGEFYTFTADSVVLTP